MSSYSDVQKAVRVEKIRIWFAWACGFWVALGLAIATKDVHIVSVITQLAFAAGGIAFTFAAVRMTNGLNRRAEAARREVLGDDFPG